MKIILKNTGGTSPGVTIVGERASLLELADVLRSNVEQAPEGETADIPLVGSAVADGGAEWIGLQIVSDISQPMKIVKRKSLWRMRGFWGFLAAIAAILFLAVLGFMSLLK